MKKYLIATALVGSASVTGANVIFYVPYAHNFVGYPVYGHPYFRNQGRPIH
jgi:hypothetical protein